MEHFSDTHPWVSDQLAIEGSWTVQRSDDSLFSSVAADQTIEQTLNRDSKTSGGIREITLTRGMHSAIFSSDVLPICQT